MGSLLRFFQYTHLPTHLQLVSRPFWSLAHRIHDGSSQSPECEVALRKLLEAKDAAVRAALDVIAIEDRLRRAALSEAPQEEFASALPKEVAEELRAHGLEVRRQRVIQELVKEV